MDFPINMLQPEYLILLLAFTIIALGLRFWFQGHKDTAQYRIAAKKKAKGSVIGSGGDRNEGEGGDGGCGGG